jgi:hypothetical protein
MNRRPTRIERPRTDLKPRHEPPTVEEAIAVARNLSDMAEHQIGIVAGLMGIGVEEAARSLAASEPQQSATRPAPIGRRGVVVVERRSSRLGSPAVRARRFAQ